MSTLRIPRGSSPAFVLTIYEQGSDGPAMDLTGIPVSIVDSTLPITPTIEVTDAVAGACQISFPDTTPMDIAKSYRMRIQVGTSGQPATFTSPAIEVMVL